MKTITEFASVHLKNAIKTADELTSGGKTAEELPAALGEALKIEGDKLKHLVHAIGMAKARSEGLKRVLVLTLAENEKPPAGAQKVEEQYYLLEFFPTAAKAGRPGQDRDEGRGRGGRDKGRGGKKGRGGRRGERGDRQARGPEGAPAAGAASAGGGEGREGGRSRRPRGRGPRPDQAAGGEGSAPRAVGPRPAIPRPKSLDAAAASSAPSESPADVAAPAEQAGNGTTS